MQTEKILELVHHALEDMKAKEITDLDVRGRSTVTDYMVIASGTSKRHVAAVAEDVIVKVKEAGLMPLGAEGQGASDWILVDLGDVVVHIMMPDARSFYDLERLWGVAADK
ncbi:MAG: ribosome silencing factor [Neptuniibacter caesariensis]|uniref:Ribosomal silencing factor RsfS n=1 Tax=Neptuniibacter caesariensis TaxID=207954 RepID=A0A2G6JBG4_NEPCE|nr:MAG: ribosome silencing factor [Neptuniibacter caesariensis]